MAKEKKSIMVDGVEYVPASSKAAASRDGMDYCIVRTYSAGVFAGYLKSRDGQEVELLDARRLWYWEGAASLSQLALEGVSKPNECKFPCEVPSVTLTQAIEIIPASAVARASIELVPVWEA